MFSDSRTIAGAQAPAAFFQKPKHKAGQIRVGNCVLAERAHAPRPKASYAARTASGLLKLLHWVRHQPIKTDDDEWLDAMMPLWAQQARERGTRPRWARERARRCLPRLVEERDVSWWLARESRERPRRGGGWTPDNLADHLGIREWWLEACFGPNCRMRCGLVSLDRPKDVREAERQAQRNGSSRRSQSAMRA